MSYVGLAAIHVIYFIQCHWSLLSFAAKWVPIMMKAADFMQRQPHGSPFISLTSAFSVSSNLNLDFHFYVFVADGFLHNNAIVHSTVFVLPYHAFYRVERILSPILLRFTRHSFVEVWILTCKSELVELLIFGLLLCLLLILILCNESSWIYCLPFSLTMADKFRLQNVTYLVLL
jgi:hypothetical protein